MQTKTEFLIWDKIVKSAKNRFDYAHYTQKLKITDNDIFDKVILHVIVAYACGESQESISTNLHNELLHIGVDIKQKKIDKFLQDKHALFNSEVYAAYITFSMLEEGSSEAEVLGYVTDLLESHHILPN